MIEDEPVKKKRKSPPKQQATWNQSKAVELAEKGVNQHDIASALHVHVNTVHRYLQRIKPEMAQVQTFKDQTGNVLALTLSRCCSVLDRLLIHYDDEDALSGLSESEKERVLGKIAITLGILFDKWRLHEGKSTVNASHQIQLTQVHKALKFGPTPSLSDES